MSLHYNWASTYFFINDTETHKFKAKKSEIAVTPLCLGNISKEWSVDNVKKTGLYGYVYDFSVDCNHIAVDDILDIHKCLMKKKWYSMICFWFKKHVFISAMMFFSCNLSNVNPLKCVSMNNQ